MKPSFGRRKFLRSGGVVMALPLLEAMPRPAQAFKPMKAAKSNGCLPVKQLRCLPESLLPKADQAGTNYEMPETRRHWKSIART